MNHRDYSQEDAYWRSQYDKESYYTPGTTYDDYRGAYKTGYEGHGRYQGKDYSAVENDLKADWERSKDNTALTWEKAKSAVKAGWHRMERAMPGDADNDGR